MPEPLTRSDWVLELRRRTERARKWPDQYSIHLSNEQVLEIASLLEAAQRDPQRLADQIVLAVSEIDDRFSPEDQPEMMLVTGPELKAIVASAIESRMEVSASQPTEIGGTVGARNGAPEGSGLVTAGPSNAVLSGAAEKKGGRTPSPAAPASDALKDWIVNSGPNSYGEFHMRQPDGPRSFYVALHGGISVLEGEGPTLAAAILAALEAAK